MFALKESLRWVAEEVRLADALEAQAGSGLGAHAVSWAGLRCMLAEVRQAFFHCAQTT